MAKPIVLITGGNSGIGRAAAVKMAARGAQVIIGCRNAERGQQAAAGIREESGCADVSLLVMDLSSRRSIEAACKEFRAGHDHLDCLIHNAADFDISRKAPAYSEDGVETVWATNHIGPVLLTMQLGKELAGSAQGRIVTVASKGLVAHPFLKVRTEDPEFRKGGFSVERAYYQSKLAQVMYTYWLAEKYRDTPVTANCIRVTNVQVDISRFPDLSDFAKKMYAMKSRMSLTPQEMAEAYAWLALSPEAAQYSGKYFDEKCRTVLSGKYSSDPANIRAVMELTERYVPGLLATQA